jgi:SpoVK/Ycf46/Vps4 family AAA+-type ATPase
VVRIKKKMDIDDIEKIAELSFNELQKRTLNVEPLTMDDFTQAIAKIKSPLSLDDIKKQEDWNKQFGAA